MRNVGRDPLLKKQLNVFPSNLFHNRCELLTNHADRITYCTLTTTTECKDDLGGLHYGQPVPRQRTVPNAGNLRNPAMRPHPAPNRLGTVENMGWEGR